MCRNTVFQARRTKRRQLCYMLQMLYRAGETRFVRFRRDITMLSFFVLFLGIFVLESKARDSADIWGGSRVFLVTDLRTSTIDVEKLYTSFADRGLAERLVIVQHGQDERFINSHGSFKTLSRAQERTFWSISTKEILPWVLKEKPNVVICMADNTDVPQILISAQRKGFLPLETKLMIWIIQGSATTADRKNEISLTSPEDLDSQSSTLDDHRLVFRKVNLISARNIENAVMVEFQREKSNIHHRDRRNAFAMTSATVGQSLSGSMATQVTSSAASSSVGQSQSSSMATQVTSSAASSSVGQSQSSSVTTQVTTSAASSSVGQSQSSSVTTQVTSSAASSSVGQSQSSSMTTQVTSLAASSSVGQSQSSSMATQVTSSAASSSVGESLPSPMATQVTSSAASSSVGQSLSSSMATQVTSSAASSSVGQSLPSSMATQVTSSAASSSVGQSLPSSMATQVTSLAASSSVGQSLPSSMATQVTSSAASSSVGQSQSSSMATQVTSSAASSSVGQSQSSSMATQVTSSAASSSVGQSQLSSMATQVTSSATSSSVGQSQSSSMTTQVTSSAASSSVGQSQSSSMTTQVTSSAASSSVGQSQSSSMATQVTSSAASSSVGQSQSSSMTTQVTSTASSSSVGQSQSSSMYTKVTSSATSSSVGQSLSSSMTTQVTSSAASSSVGQSQTSSMYTKVTSLAASSTVSSSMVTSSTATSTTTSVVTSKVGQLTSIPVTARETAPVVSHTASQFVSRSVVTSESVSSLISKSKSTAVAVSSFIETQAITATSRVFIKPSSPVSSLTTPAISPFSSSVPTEPSGLPSTSSRTTLVIATSQPIVSSSVPVISSKLPRTSSVETSSTSRKVLSSSMTSGSTKLPTSIIFPTSTKTGPLPSSSHAVVTERPPVYKNETIVIEFEGNCNDVVGKKETEEQFGKEFVNEVAKELNIKQSAIVVSDVTCGSILVTFTITGVSGIPNVSQELKKLVENGNISVTVNGKTFKANKLEVVRPTIPSTVVPTTEAKNEIAFILYITFGGLMAFIFIVGIIVLFVRCRRDRREGSFYLTNETNYELRRFQGIPRANSYYSRMNYYGEPVEKDATAADPDAEDEFQAAAGAYPYNLSPASARGKPIAAASGDSKEEKFNVGTMGMPEWKNLPKLSQEGIAVAEPKEGIPKSSGSVGSRELLLEGESGPADSRHAYDNPVLTFGDGPTGLDKEDS